jgi:hypothetical protein
MSWQLFYDTLNSIATGCSRRSHTAYACTVPIFQSSGTFRLQTSDDPDTVIDEFFGPIPPVLALQWGVADKVSTEGDTAIYSVSYLFGLRSGDVTVHTKTDSTAGGGYVIESEVTVDDQPLALSLT